MNKILFTATLLIILQSCSYEPIFSNKNNNIYFQKIEIEGNKKINNVIENNLKTTNGNIPYKISIKTEKLKNVVSTNSKGDPTVFEIKIITDFMVTLNGNKVLKDIIIKTTTYNNISDKFELYKYEDNLIKNLSLNISNEILNEIKSLN